MSGECKEKKANNSNKCFAVKNLIKFQIDAVKTITSLLLFLPEWSRAIQLQSGNMARAS